MSKHLSRWIAVLALLAIVDWALTIHAHLTYHHHPGGPTIMPLGQLLGWVTSIGLVVVIMVLLIARQRQRTWRYDEIPPGPIPPPRQRHRGAEIVHRARRLERAEILYLRNRSAALALVGRYLGAGVVRAASHSVTQAIVCS